MALTENGVSTTKDKGQFAYEVSYNSIVKRDIVYWDYRDLNGKLHAGSAKTIEQAKQKASECGYTE
jgi:hypothetical protein